MTAPFPQRLGEYELVARLGVGGMAETFVAVRRGENGFEQRVCLKRMLPAFADDADFVALFEREAALSALLHHGNIVQVLDFGVADGSHYLTLELVEGIDLRSLLRHLRHRAELLDPTIAVKVAYALGRALDFAHSADERGNARGVIHRDVSPANTLLSVHGEVKLADFGVAKAMREPRSILSHALKGKVPYMAPEYALGRQCSPRSDLFSLGVLLYECLAGFRPFDGDNDLETLDRARHGRRLPLAESATEAPPILIDAVEALLAPEPRRRPAHAGVLLESLDALGWHEVDNRVLAALVDSVRSRSDEPSLPGLAATRPANADTRRDARRR